MKTDSRKTQAAPATMPRRGLCRDARPIGPRVPSLTDAPRGGGDPMKTVFLALAVGIAAVVTLTGTIIRPAATVTNLTAR
jgi:hypothetical protein